MHNDGAPLHSWEFFMPYSEKDLFKDHFINIAPTFGWFVYDVGQARIKAVVPVSDFPRLDAIQQDPGQWVLAHYDTNAPAVGPANTDLVGVMVLLRSENRGMSVFWIVLTAVISLGGVALLCSAVMALTEKG